MARQSGGRARLGRMFSPRRRIATPGESQVRRAQRAKRWRERFRRFSLSTWQSSRIVEGVCALFRISGETARAVRGATGAHFVGAGYRQLRIEGLEERQMLDASAWNLAAGDFSQDWTNVGLITP